MKTGDIIDETDSLILYNKLCQHLVNLYTVNQHFPNDPCLMLQNKAQVKNPLNTESSLIWLQISHCNLNCNLRNFQLSYFGLVSKTIHDYQKILLK